MENSLKDGPISLCNNYLLTDHIEREADESFAKGVLDSIADTVVASVATPTGIC